MYDKKQPVCKSPDLSKMQEVVIDHKTKIYISLEADPIEAKNKYFARLSERNR